MDLEEDVEKAQADLAQMEASHNEAVAKFKKEAVASQAEKVQLEEDAKELGRKQIALRTEVETLEAQIQSMTAEHEITLQARDDEMKARLAKAQVEHGEHVAKIMAEVSSLKSTTDARYTALDQKKTSVEEALAQEQATIATMKKEAEVAAAELDAAKKDNNKKAAEVTQLKLEMNEAATASKTRLREMEDDCKTKLEQQQQEFDVENENAAGQRAALEEQLEQLQSRLQEQEDAASAALATKQDECSESMHKQEEAFNTEKAAMKKDLKLKNAENDALKAEVERLRINTPEILHQAEDKWKAKLTQLSEEHHAEMEPLKSHLTETTNRLKRLEEDNSQLNARIAAQKLATAAVASKHKEALEKQEGDYQIRAAKLEKQRIEEVAAVQTELDRCRSDATERQHQDDEARRQEIAKLEAEHETKVEALKRQINALETRLNEANTKLSAQKLASAAALSKEKKAAATAVEQEGESAKVRLELLEKQKTEQIENLEAEQSKLKIEQSKKLSELADLHDEKIKKLELGFNAEKVALAAQIVKLKADVEDGHNQLAEHEATALEDKKKLKEEAKAKLKERDEKQIQKILKLETLKVEEINTMKEKLAKLQEESAAAALNKEEEWKGKLEKLRAEQTDVEQVLKAEILQLKASHEKELDDVKQAFTLESQQQEGKAQAEMEAFRKEKESELAKLDETIVALKKEKASDLMASSEKTAAEVLNNLLYKSNHRTCISQLRCCDLSHSP